MSVLTDFNTWLEEQLNNIVNISGKTSIKLQLLQERKLYEIWNIIIINKIHLIEDENELIWALQKIESKLNELEDETNKIVKEEYLKEISSLAFLAISVCYAFGYIHSGNIAKSKYNQSFNNLISASNFNELLKMLKKNKIPKGLIAEPHMKEIRGLVEESVSNLIGGNLKLGKRQKDIIKKTLLYEIPKGIKKKLTTEKVAEIIAEKLKEKGIKSLDGAKRNFDIVKYTKKIMGTVMTNAFNIAVKKRLEENGQYYVILRGKNTKNTCDDCKKARNKIYCIAPKNKPELNPLNQPYLVDCKGVFHHYCKCYLESIITK